jgi:hypothetical protein
MTTKFLDFLRNKPSTEKSSEPQGVINVSSNGTSSVPPEELEKILFERLAELDPTEFDETGSGS